MLSMISAPHHRAGEGRRNISVKELRELRGVVEREKAAMSFLLLAREIDKS